MRGRQAACIHRGLGGQASAGIHSTEGIVGASSASCQPGSPHHRHSEAAGCPVSDT
jgi:hypothetical protein